MKNYILLNRSKQKNSVKVVADKKIYLAFFVLCMLLSMKLSAQLPYARIEYENRQLFYIYNNPDPYVDEEYVNIDYLTVDTYLRLYADENCTIPYKVPVDSIIIVQVAENNWLGTNAGGGWYASVPDNILMWPSAILAGQSQSIYTYYSRPDGIAFYNSFWRADSFAYTHEVLPDTNYPAKYLPAPTFGISW